MLLIAYTVIIQIRQHKLIVDLNIKKYMIKYLKLVSVPSVLTLHEWDATPEPHQQLLHHCAAECSAPPADVKKIY